MSRFSRLLPRIAKVRRHPTDVGNIIVFILRPVAIRQQRHLRNTQDAFIGAIDRHRKGLALRNGLGHHAERRHRERLQTQVGSAIIRNRVANRPYQVTARLIPQRRWDQGTVAPNSHQHELHVPILVEKPSCRSKEVVSGDGCKITLVTTRESDALGWIRTNRDLRRFLVNRPVCDGRHSRDDRKQPCSSCESVLLADRSEILERIEHEIGDGGPKEKPKWA